MTVLITLTTAGTDTGPFDLYSNADGYVSAFETGVSKAALQAGYSSSLVPNTATIIRVKSTGVCTNYIDIVLTGTTTTTTSSSSTSTTTTTTTTAFVCNDCRNWNYVSGNIPVGGDVIHYYNCVDGAPQSIALSYGDPTGNFCNCNDVGLPYTDNGTTITEIGICTPTGCTEYTLDSGGSPASIEWFGCDSNYYTHTFTGEYIICTDGSGYTVTSGSVTQTGSQPCSLP